MQLPHLYWIARYFINDYLAYGLDLPPPGFQYIRYGPDLLLVNLITGEISETIPGFFDQSAPPDAGPDDGQEGPPPDSAPQ